MASIIIIVPCSILTLLMYRREGVGSFLNNIAALPKGDKRSFQG
jgi:hypothetical protein